MSEPAGRATLAGPLPVGTPAESLPTRTTHPPRGPRWRLPATTAKQRLWALRILVYGGLIVSWQITAIRQGKFYLPTIPATLSAFVDLFTEGYYEALGPTLQQLAAGFFIAMAIAIPFGALMGRFKVAEDLFSPWVNALFVTSKEALLPVLLIAFGTEFWYRVSVVILFAAFFPIMNTAAGVRYVNEDLKETARAFGTRPWRMFTRIYLPAAAPFVLTGVRLGLGMAIKGMVIAELWIFAGTGRLLSDFVESPRRLDLFYATVLLILIVAVTLDVVLKVLERRLWPGVSGGARARRRKEM